jgi:hypothetical protein
MGSPRAKATSDVKQIVASTLQASMSRISRTIFRPGTSGRRAFCAQALHLGLAAEDRPGHRAQTRSCFPPFVHQGKQKYGRTLGSRMWQALCCSNSSKGCSVRFYKSCMLLVCRLAWKCSLSLTPRRLLSCIDFSMVAASPALLCTHLSYSYGVSSRQYDMLTAVSGYIDPAVIC